MTKRRGPDREDPRFTSQREDELARRSPEVQLRTARAQMEAGHYRRALEIAEPFAGMPVEHPWIAQLIVLRRVLNVVVRELHIPSQVRDSQAARELEALAERRLSAPGTPIPEEFLFDVLRRDALCLLAWRLLGTKEQAGGGEHAVGRSIAIAWLDADEPAHWVNALLDCLHGMEFRLLPALFVCGDELTSGRLMPLAREVLPSTDEPGENRDWVELMEETLALGEQTIREARVQRHEESEGAW